MAEAPIVDATHIKDSKVWKAYVVCRDQDLKADVMFGEDGEVIVNVSRFLSHKGEPLAQYVVSKFQSHDRLASVRLIALEGDGDV